MSRRRAIRGWSLRALVAALVVTAIATTLTLASFIRDRTSTGETAGRASIEVAQRLDELAVMTFELHPAIGGPAGSTVAASPELALEMAEIGATDTTDYAELRRLALELHSQAGTILGASPAVDASVFDARQRTVEYSVAIADHLATGAPVPEPPPGVDAPVVVDHRVYDEISDAIRALDESAIAALDQRSNEPSIVPSAALVLLTVALGVAVGAVLRRDRELDRERARELMHLAGHDDLTGLLNRSQLEPAFDLIRPRNGRGLGLLFLDLDGFKQINDSLGHHAGDAVLQTVADRLASMLRDHDYAVRHGGDEFILLLSDVRDLGEVARVAERVVEEVSRPILVEDETVDVGVSVGANITRNPAAELDTVMRDADAALYAAKRAGKGQVVCATGSLTIPPGEERHGPASFDQTVQL